MSLAPGVRLGPYEDAISDVPWLGHAVHPDGKRLAITRDPNGEVSVANDPERVLFNFTDEIARRLRPALAPEAR